MATATEFQLRMNKRADDLGKNVVKLKTKVALAVQLQLVQTTPVDTSAALSNWIATLDQPSYYFEQPYVAGEYGSTRQQSMGQAYNQVIYALSDMKMGQDIYIQNNAPYIQTLNDGSSSQAPAGFVESAVLVGLRSIRGVRLLA